QEIRTSFYVANVVKEDDVQVMAEGQTVKHETYGLGIVTASDQERTAIDFDDHGPKLFVTSIMVAELIGEAPATPPKNKRRRKPAAPHTPKTKPPPNVFPPPKSRKKSPCRYRRCYCCRQPLVVPFSLRFRTPI